VKWERFSTQDATIGTVLSAAFDEAGRRGDRKVGTDHLLLGLLHDPASAEALGIGVEEGRAALADLDRAALAAIGLDLGTLDLPGLPTPKHRLVTRNTLTAGARDALTGAVSANGSRTRGLTPKHLLASVLTCPSTEPAAHLLGRLGIDPGAAGVRLGQTEA
jgi:hypothetical protein